jgi:DNA-directed RNA polymerase subunit RPC12/RpoP
MANDECGMIFFNFTEDNDIDGRILTENESYPIINVNKNTARFNHYQKIIVPASVYIVDIGENINSLASGISRPAGNIKLTEGSRFEFTSGKTCKLFVTYIYFDVLRYSNVEQNKFFIYFASNTELSQNIANYLREQDETHILPVNDVDEHHIIHNERNNDDDNEWTLNLHDDNIPQIAPDLNFPEPILLEEDRTIIQTDFNLYGDLVEKYEKSLAIPLYEEENCVVSLNEIKCGDYFYKCSQCKKPFDYYVFKRWVNTNKSCPHCRHQYDNYPQVYIKRRSPTDLIRHHVCNGYMLLCRALQYVIL